MAGEGTRGGGRVRSSREKARRGSKTVHVVRGLPLPSTELGTRLRGAFWIAGTVRRSTLDSQGDHAEWVVAWLRNQGLDAKHSGG